MITAKEWLEMIENNEKEIRETAKNELERSNGKWIMLSLTPTGNIETSLHDSPVIVSAWPNYMVAVFEDIAGFESDLTEIKIVLKERIAEQC